MALPTASYVVFPDLAAIIKHIENHPLVGALKTSAIASVAPDGIQKVADYFACKVMEREAIRSNLVNALRFPVNKRMLNASLLDCPPVYVLPVILFEQTLNDLLDRATYVPSLNGNVIRQIAS